MKLTSIRPQIRFMQNNSQHKMQSVNIKQTTPNAQAGAPEVTTKQIIFGLYTDEQIKQINESKMLPKGTKAVSNNGRGQLGGYRIVMLLPTDTKEPRYLPEGCTLKRTPTGAVLAFRTQIN